MKKYLDKLSQAYYAGEPLVSDEEFDRLADLHSYESVGYKDGEYPHHFRMYSLKKVHFGEDCPPLKNPIRTPKLDGAAISLLYVPVDLDNARLVMALTRGDGYHGKDITDKVRHLVPQYINANCVIQFNCEVISPKTIPNARNYAAGALNLKDIGEVKKRDIRIVVLDVLGTELNTYNERLEYARFQLFDTVLDINVDKYPTDGHVVRELYVIDYEEAGYTARHPRGAYALKPKAEVVLTKLLDVEWNTGRTGVVTPTAILEPCKIGGATISRATLHNIEYIQQLNLELGCDVEVIRSGEIIPRVVRRV